MLWWLRYANPPLYAALYTSAAARHWLARMPPEQHYALMRIWYGA